MYVCMYVCMHVYVHVCMYVFRETVREWEKGIDMERENLKQALHWGSIP